MPLGSLYEAAGFYNIIDGPHFTSMSCYTTLTRKNSNKHFTLKFEVFEFCEVKKVFWVHLKVFV